MWDVIPGIPVEEDLEKKLAKVGLSKIKRLMRTANEERVDSVSVMLELLVLPGRVRVPELSWRSLGFFSLCKQNKPWGVGGDKVTNSSVQLLTVDSAHHFYMLYFM